MRTNNILCIYDSEINKDIFLEYYPNMLLYNTNTYILYFGGIYNPPFFDIVIMTSSYKKANDYQMCWNMVIENGHLIIPKTALKHLSKYDIKKVLPFNDKSFVIIKKNSSKVYIFYDKYRVIDFIVSSPNKLLLQHKDIYIPEKDLNFLENNWTKSLEWYKKHFNYRKKIVGDYDPNIIYLSYLHTMLQKINPCIKIIIILQNPIIRAYEDWLNNDKNEKGKYKNTFEDSINNELKFRLNEPITNNVSKYHYLQKGLYYKQIQILQRYFPLQNICITLYENINYEKIYKFLQVYPYNHTHVNKETQTNTQKITQINKNIIIKKSLSKKLVKFFKDDVKKLEKDILGYKTNWF